MFKKPISLAVTVIGTSALATIAACGSSSSGNNSGGNNSSNHNNSSAANNNSSGGNNNSSGGNNSQANNSSNNNNSNGSASAGGTCDGTCGGTASGAVIDDMTSSTKITFAPPSCATAGSWFTFVNDTGTVTPSGKFTYSAQPAGLPSSASTSPAGAADSGTDSGTTTADSGTTGTDSGTTVADSGTTTGGDSGTTSGPVSACVQGTTAITQYAVAGLGINLATACSPADGGASLPATIDAHTYTGVEFWLWVSAADAAAVSDALIVQFFDKNETPGFNVCDPNGTAGTACGAAGAAVMGTPVSTSNGAGNLLQADGGTGALVAGWQLVQIPFTNFIPNMYYGGSNEPNGTVDPTSLTKLQFQIQQTLAADAGPMAVSFDFCVSDLKFYN